jgi:hypothetical protein
VFAQSGSTAFLLESKTDHHGLSGIMLNFEIIARFDDVATCMMERFDYKIYGDLKPQTIEVSTEKPHLLDLRPDTKTV